MEVTVSATEAPPLSSARIREVRSIPVLAPPPFSLANATQTLHHAPLLLVWLTTDDGVVGTSYAMGLSVGYLRAMHEIVQEFVDLVTGQPASPVEIDRRLRSWLQPVGGRNPVSSAINAIEMATWDVVAKVAGLPLVSLLGGEPRAVPAYDSRAMAATPAQAAEEAAAAAEAGFGAMKIKMGRPRFEDDLAVFSATRAEVPDGFRIMVDFVRSLDVDEAIRRGKVVDDEGAYWIEEPLRVDDFRGLARVTSALSTPIMIGENFGSSIEMQDAIEKGACDFVSPDLGHVGGITGFLRCAALAHIQSVPMSSHIYPEINAHVLPLVPTGHYLEWMDLAGSLKAERREPVDGEYVASEEPGIGVEWDNDAVARHSLLSQ
jgi:mandelate racemase